MNDLIITRRSNPKIKWLRSLLTTKGRKTEPFFVADGVRLLEESWPCPIHALVWCPEVVAKNSRAQRLKTRLESHSQSIIAVDRNVLQSISDTVTSQGLIGVFPIIPPRLDNLADLCLALDNIRDPGNMGTILRTARAAAVSQILILGDSVDVYNPKVIRSAMGAHFHLELIVNPDLSILQKASQIVLADARAVHAHNHIEWADQTVLIIGSEAHGFQTDFPADWPVRKVKIPMAPGTESLNAAVAAGVLLMAAYQARNET